MRVMVMPDHDRHESDCICAGGYVLLHFTFMLERTARRNSTIQDLLNPIHDQSDLVSIACETRRRGAVFNGRI